MFKIRSAVWSGIVLLAVLVPIASKAPASAFGDDQYHYVGEIKFLPYSSCPRGFVEAKGQTLPVPQYATLFSLIGTRFGGNGHPDFALPAVQAPKASTGAALLACLATSGSFPPRN